MTDTKDTSNTKQANKIIKVIDAPCGYGKTQWSIQYMKENHEYKRFIFITPFISEIERIQDNLSDFKAPEKVKGKKINDIKRLILDGENIVSTHELFKNFNEEIQELLQQQGYTLILDEVMNIIDNLKVGKDAIKILKEKNKITIDSDTHIIYWNENEELLDISPEFTRAQKLIQKKDVIEVNGVGLVWTLPIRYFKCFDDIYILTYMFDCQLQAYYYKSNNIKWNKYSVSPTEETKNNTFPNIEYRLVNYKDRIKYNKDNIKSLINIYEGKLNTIGQKKKWNKNNYISISPPDGTLSSTWFEKAKTNDLEILNKNLYNYYRNIVKSKQDDRIWTCKMTYKNNRNLVNTIGNRYKNNHISMTVRGTNKHQDAFNLAYITNRYLNVMEKSYFMDVCKIEVNEELWSLSELIQWMYRSRIRQGQEINIYIPSIRMRKLLQWWLNQNEI